MIEKEPLKLRNLQHFSAVIFSSKTFSVSYSAPSTRNSVTPQPRSHKAMWPRYAPVSDSKRGSGGVEGTVLCCGDPGGRTLKISGICELSRALRRWEGKGRGNIEHA